MDYASDIRIDEHALDFEWLEQPALMYKYTTLVAEKKRDMDLLNEEMTILRAQKDKRVRKFPEKYGVDKVTEGTVAAAIPLIPAVQELAKKIIEARFELQVVQGAVSSIEQRKSALENMVKLFGQQYFAGPSMPRDLTWEREEKQKRANTKVKMQRRSK